MSHHREDTTPPETTRQVYHWALLGYRIVTGLTVGLGFLVVVLTLGALWRHEAGSATPVDVLRFLGLLVLFAVVDLIPLVLRDKPISLGFPVILLALLEAANRLGSPGAAALVAVGIGALGALLSGALRSLLLERWPLRKSLTGILYYASHHALACLTAAQAYDWVARVWSPLWGLENINIQATLIYALVYSLLSTILVWPHDYLIGRLLLPASEKRFPRVTPLSAIGTAPVPMVLLAAVEGGWSSIFLFLLYLAFLAVTRSWTTIEVRERRLRAQERLRKALGVPANMDELARNVKRALDDLASYQWAALYSAETGDEVYRLRREWQFGGSIVSRDDVSGEEEPAQVENTATAEMTQTPEGQTLTWPDQVFKGQGYLGQVVEFGGPLGGVDPHLSLAPHPVFLYLPLQYEGTIIGLLAIVRPKRLFKERELTSVEDLAVVMAESLRQVQQVEQELERLSSRASQFARHPERIQKVLRELSDRRVDIAKILARIAERAFQGSLRTVLEDVVVGGTSGRGELSISDSELRAIYNRIREETPGMPTLDDDILEKLQVIPADLSLAFTFRFQWPEFDRGEEYTKLYDFFVQALDAQSAADIAGLRQMADDTIEQARREGRIPPEVITQFSSLVEVVRLVKQSHEATATDQQQAHAASAINEIRALDDRVSERLKDPERFIFLTLIANWLTILIRSLDALEQGGAQLKVRLRSDYALPTEQVTIVLIVDNVGQGAASRLVVKMQPSQDYQIFGQSQIELGILPPFRSEELEFTIQPETEDELRTEFQVTYRDREREQKQQLFADVVHLRAAPPPFTDIVNPYVTGVPLRTNSEVFFGREDVFEFIERNMVSTTLQQQVLLLIGERRTGKTSILKQLPARLSDQEYIHVFLDCQGVGVDGGTASFFSDLTDFIVDSLEDVGVSVDWPSGDTMERGAFRIFTRQFLPCVWEKIGDRRLLIAIDEYEILETRVHSGTWGQEIFDHLRSLMQHQNRLAFVFAGTHELEAMSSDYWHIFFNMAKYHRVGFLDEKAAVRLITEPVRAYSVVYDDLALDEMLCSTGGHPYFLQLLCDHLVELCNQERRSYVTVQHVRDALEHVLTGGKAHLAFIWGDSTPVERAVLASLAQALTLGERTMMDTIATYLGKAGIAYDRQELYEAMQRLEARQIVIRKRDRRGTVHYDFATYLYYIWVQKYHSLE